MRRTHPTTVLFAALLAVFFAALTRGPAARAQFGPQPPPPGDPSGGGGTTHHAADSTDLPQPRSAFPAPSAGNPADDGPCTGPRVTHVAFVGLQRITGDDIRDSLHVREGQCYVRGRLTTDAHALWDLGFFSDVQVAADPSAQGGMDIRFIVIERPSIHAIRVVGFDAVEEDKVREVIELREGSILSESQVRRTDQRIRDMYAEKGYFLAEVRHEIVRGQAGDNEADVVFHITEGPQVQVRSIQFVGNNNISAEDLRGVMSTSAANFFSFITSTGTYREEGFRNDMDMLHAAYYDRGYLNVEIDNPRVALAPDRQFLDITVYVREGPRYRVGNVNIVEVDDNDHEIPPLGGVRHIRDMVHVRHGDYFSRTTIAHDIIAVQTAYRDGGYATVDITPDAQPRPTDREVDVAVRIRRGPLMHVHRVLIRGNQKTADRVIRREVRIFEGDQYNETNYQNSRRRVMQMGYFERVDLSTETVPDHPDWINVNVEVVERPTGTFQIGAGFSSVESFIATAQIQQLNLFGRGQSLTLQAQFSALRQIFALRFVEPYLLDSYWTGAVDVYNTLRVYTDFTRQSTGGSLSTSYPLIGTNDLRLGLTYTGEYVTVARQGVATLLGATQGVTPVFGNVPLANLFRNGFTSAIGASLVLDTRDNRLFPTNGVYARASFEIADPYTGSVNVSYIRASAFARFYYPLFWGIVFKSNFTGGFIASRDPRGVPIAERYFLGGILDVRGFQLRSIGPRLPVPQNADPNSDIVANGVNIGGNVEFYYNLELEFPILESIGVRGVLFTDAGNVWNTESQYCAGAGGAFQNPATAVINPCVANPLVLRTSWGVGLRWFSPLGLLRFEWGFPFAPLSYEQSNVFEFTIGNFF